MPVFNGPVNVIGATPEYFTGLATQTASSGIPQALGQVWKGSGQSFFGSAGQALAGNLAGSAVNVALNSAFSTDVVGPQGFKLDSGANILASTITPYVTGAVAGGINQQIQQSLKNAGPFGPLLSSFGTQAVNQITNGITNSIFGAATPGNGTNVKMWPGAGMDGIEEPEADYGEGSYPLTDIYFSLRRANVGPQQDGDSQTVNSPKTETTVPATTATSSEGAAAASTNADVNYLKEQAMKVDLNATIKPFDVNETIGGGSGDPLGVLRGTKWDDLPQFTRDPISPIPRPKPLF